MKRFGFFSKLGAAVTVVSVVLFMTACSSSSSSGKKAKFVDSAVIGISYKTSSGIEGVTGDDGSFNFKKGDSVTFYIGEIELPGVMPLDAYVTPAHIANTADWEDSALAVNIARFLQSLDADGDLENGIQIPEGIAELFTEDLAIDFSNTGMFESYFQILLNNINEGLDLDLVIVSAANAKAHLKATIDALGITITIDTTACNMTDVAGYYNGTFSNVGAQTNEPYSDTGKEYSIELGMDRSLRIEDENVGGFCSFSNATVDMPIVGEITTDTYTWVVGNGAEIYTLSIIQGGAKTMTVVVANKVNGTFTLQGPML